MGARGGVSACGWEWGGVPAKHVFRGTQNDRKFKDLVPHASLTYNLGSGNPRQHPVDMDHDVKRQRTTATDEERSERKNTSSTASYASATASASASSDSLFIPAANDDDEESEEDSEEEEEEKEVKDFATLVEAICTNATKNLDGPWGSCFGQLPTLEQAKQLAGALELNTSLTRIRITDTAEDGGIGDDVWAVLFAAFGRGATPNLKSLNLEWNELGDDAAAALAACVRAGGLSNLKYLQLNHNPMGDAGAICIADCASMGGFPELKELNISNNSVDFGCKATTEFLTACVSSGSFPKLGRMYINDDPWPKKLEEACKARKIVLRHY